MFEQMLYLSLYTSTGLCPATPQIVNIHNRKSIWFTRARTYKHWVPIFIILIPLHHGKSSKNLSNIVRIIYSMTHPFLLKKLYKLPLYKHLDCIAVV